MSYLTFKDLIPKLKSLSLNLQSKAYSVSQGAHTGYRKGFEDDRHEYRHYVSGDDLRYLDWRLFARTDKYYIREGYQKSKQKIFVWLDTSMSQRFFDEKFNISWLLAMSFAYLYQKQNDRVLFHGENNSTRLLNMKSASDFISLENYFLKRNSSTVKKESKLSFEESVALLKSNITFGNKIVWITDLYIPLNNFLTILDAASGLKANLNLVHLTSKQDYSSRKLKTGFLKKLVDVETGAWLPSSKVHNYDEIWEKAIDTRMRYLIGRGHNYIKGNVEDGPLNILGGCRFL